MPIIGWISQRGAPSGQVQTNEETLPQDPWLLKVAIILAPYRESPGEVR